MRPSPRGSFEALGGYNEKTLRIGILTVGSLFWDGSEIRCGWRRQRLAVREKRMVRVPIRYGRLSQSRGNTYTMVFARSCETAEQMGTGLVLPASADCREPAQLVEEAEHLWAVESNSLCRAGVAANWGRVCLRQPPEAPLPKEFDTAWQGAVRAAGPRYRAVPTAREEAPLLDPSSGMALFSWPTDVETGALLSGFDALLLTATEATFTSESSYASPRTVAEAWRNDPHGNAAYFYNNRLSGITTFEDEQIQLALKGVSNREDR